MDKRYIVAGPLVEVAIKLKRPAHQDKLLAALDALAAKDSSFSYSCDPGSGQTIARGMSEEYLDASVEVLRRACNTDIEIGTSQVAYRECIVGDVQIEYTHAKQYLGGGEFARVVLSFGPGAVGSDFIFENMAGAAVRDDLVPGVLKGLDGARKNGVVAGYPLIEFRAALIDGAYHEVDSSPRTFEIAAREAFKRLRNERVVRLLEPIMAVEISGLQQLRDAFIDNLKARRGVIQDEDFFVVRALVPLADMLGYRNAFPTLSQGYGQFTMRYSHREATSSGDDDPGRFRPAAAMRLRA